MEMNGNFLENIESLKRCIFNAKKKIEQWEEVEVEDDYIISDGDARLWKHEGIEYKLVSSYPEKEAELYTANIDFDRDNLFVVFGIIHVGLLKYIRRNMSSESKMLIVEPDVKKLKYVLTHEDIRYIFEDNNVGLIICDSFDTDVKHEIDAYISLGWDNLVYNLQVILLANYTMYKQIAHSFVQYIHEKMSYRITILGNCLEDAFNGFSNTYTNIPAFFEANSINEIRNKFAGVPGIVVASGPSLEKNIGVLKEANDKAVIIACDASVQACRANGVKLDGVASVERDEPTYTYYYQGKTFEDDLVLFGPSVLWPQIYEEYKGKKVITSKTNIGPEWWINKHFDNVLFENIGVSSANVAFEALLLAGCDPIILVGQDLAYTDSKKHAEGTHTEFEGENDASESDGTMVEDIYGNMVQTDFVYNLFRSWFENKIADYCENIEVIDATEGGAKIKGTNIATLKETIEKYCVKEKNYNIYDCLSDVMVTKKQKLEKYKKMIKEGKSEIGVIRNIQRTARKHYQLLERLYEKGIEKQSEKQLIETVQQMEKGNQIIAEIEEKDSVCTLFRPIVKQTITHVKALGNELTGENVIANLKLQGNLMGMIMRSCDLIIEEFEKMVDSLVKQKERLEQQ